MPAYEYLALNSKGRQKKGVLEGDSPRQVRQLLRDRQLTPIEVEEVSQGASRVSGRGGHLSSADLALLLRQLSTLVRSGMPVEEALLAVAQQTDKRPVKRVIVGVRAKVMEGHSLAAGMADFPQVFGDLYRATIEAGEHSGNLDTVLERLADYAENSQALRQQILLALLYPVIITIVAISAVVGLTIYVVPPVIEAITSAGGELPLLTRSLIAFSEFLQQHGLALLIAIIVISTAATLFFRRPGPKYALHGFWLRAPLTGRLTRGINAARFARTLSILAASGVPILDALRIASRVVVNLPMQAAIDDAALRVREGAPIHRALGESKLFPPMLLHLIANGEASGELEAMLDRAAENQERELNTTLSAMLGLLGPLLILTMGLLVMLIVVAILLPIFQINQLIQ